MVRTSYAATVAVLFLVASQICRADDVTFVSTSNGANSTELSANQPGDVPGDLEDGPSWMEGGFLEEPKWLVYAGAIVMHRSNPSPGQLVIPTAGAGTISNASDFGFNPGASAPDIMVTRNFQNGWGIQTRYFGSLNWDSGLHDYGAVGNVRIGSFSNFGVTDLTGSYTSRLQNFELNGLRTVNERFTFLAGFRAVEVADRLMYRITFPAFNADYHWAESNKLYGGQLGGVFNLWKLDSRLSVNCATKAGVFSNTAQNSFNLLPSTGGSFPGGGARTNTAFVGDINIYATYRLTNHLSAYGGYQMLWVQQVALASDQAKAALAASSQTGISTHGDVFYSGATFGLAFIW